MNRNGRIALAVVLASAFFVETFASPSAQDRGKFVDPRDEREYAWVRLGGTVWMAENLNYGTWRRSQGRQGWDNCAEPSSQATKLCYDDSAQECLEYGGLYYFEDAKKSCPPGWRLPNEREWIALSAAAGSGGLQSNKENSWRAHAYGGAASNPHGWGGLPGGDFSAAYGAFGNKGHKAAWWVDGDSGDCADLDCYASGVTLSPYDALSQSTMFSSCDALSVR